MRCLRKCKGNVPKKSSNNKVLDFLYRTESGRRVLKVLVHPAVSNIGRVFLNTRLSCVFINPFIRANNIDLSGCEKFGFNSYNDFFHRRYRKGYLDIDMNRDDFISPCDARLSVYEIGEDSVFNIKNTEYDLHDLLKDKKLAERYKGGHLWLYRLCVDDYHRYIYPVNGIKSGNRRINGVYHTVQPIANDYYPIYKENTREYCLIKTKDAGTVLMMEVGALLVGRIANDEICAARVSRGGEKGHFEFGGSTIIVMTQKDKVVPDRVYTESTACGIETVVKLGQKVGVMKN